jgi:hypothetical protein
MAATRLDGRMNLFLLPVGLSSCERGKSVLGEVEAP